MKTNVVLLTILMTVQWSVAQAPQRSVPGTDGKSEAASGNILAASGTTELRIPQSKRSVSEVIRMAEEEFGGDLGTATLVSVEWSFGNRFAVPKMAAPESWPEADTEWSWFVTYRWNGKSGDRIKVFRVRESGEINSEDFDDPVSDGVDSADRELVTTPPIQLVRDQTGGKNSVEDWIHLLADDSDATRIDGGGDPVKSSILRIRRDMMRLIIADVREAETLTERKKYLEEFLGKSGEFLNEFPLQESVWLLRAIVALELERTSEGWDAGQKVWEFFQDRIDDSKVRGVLAKLERKGWLRDKPFEVARRGVPSWTNSVGMVFVPIDGTDLLMSIWETRVKDFESFTESARHDTGNRMNVVQGDQLGEFEGYNWRNPGFAQTKDDPVVGVSGEDAIAYCEWLTERERREGRIENKHRYRLPRDEEWNRAAGEAFYPWGNQWPPPANAGNYAGDESKDGNWPQNSLTIEDYRDGFAKTAPVGSFAANQYGLFDVGGNVWEWCENLYSMNPRQRAQRGASWFNQAPEKLMVAFRAAEPSSRRSAWVGFRCVLDLGNGSE